VNRSELIDTISRTTSLARRQAEAAVAAFVSAVMSEVRAGRKVSLVGFGSFNPTRRGARMGRNPRTGAPVRIGPSMGVRFSPSTTFKDVINGRAEVPVVKAAPAATAKRTAKKATAKRATAKRATKKATAKRTAKKATAKRATAKRATKKATAKRTAKR
jgi:DNA-binding protein HU-beta